MALYNMSLEGEVLKVGFGESASNDEIVKEVAVSIQVIKEQCHGKIIKVNGPASLPVAMALAHELAHVTKAIAAYDPKLAKYVVAVAHGGSGVAVGDLID